jgi:hypothetical protein
VVHSQRSLRLRKNIKTNLPAMTPMRRNSIMVKGKWRERALLLGRQNQAGGKIAGRAPMAFRALGPTSESRCPLIDHTLRKPLLARPRSVASCGDYQFYRKWRGDSVLYAFWCLGRMPLFSNDREINDVARSDSPKECNGYIS